MTDVELDCQQCGDLIYTATEPAEIQDIARNPHNYILFCNACRKELGFE